MKLTNGTVNLFKLIEDAISEAKTKGSSTLVLKFEKASVSEDIEAFGLITTDSADMDLDFIIKNLHIIPDFIEIKKLNLSVRSYNCLARYGIRDTGALKKALVEGVNDERYPAYNYPLFKVRNLGPKSANEILHRLADMICMFNNVQKEDNSNET